LNVRTVMSIIVSAFCLIPYRRSVIMVNTRGPNICLEIKDYRTRYHSQALYSFIKWTHSYGAIRQTVASALISRCCDKLEIWV